MWKDSSAVFARFPRIDIVKHKRDGHVVCQVQEDAF